METPIRELIVKLEGLRDSIPDEDAMYRGGVINAIRLGEEIEIYRLTNEKIKRNK